MKSLYAPFDRDRTCASGTRTDHADRKNCMSGKPTRRRDDRPLSRRRRPRFRPHARRSRGGHPPRAGGRRLHLLDRAESCFAGERDHPSRRRASVAPGPAKRPHPAGLCRHGGDRSELLRVLPRRPARGGRSRPGLHAGDRAHSLLQGFPRHPGASPFARVVDGRPARFRLLPAEPILGRVPDRHPSGGAHRQGRLPRSRHRPRRRLDGADRGQRVHAAGRDARRHRARTWATAIPRCATAC